MPRRRKRRYAGGTVYGGTMFGGRAPSRYNIHMSNFLKKHLRPGMTKSQRKNVFRQGASAWRG